MTVTHNIKRGQIHVIKESRMRESKLAKDSKGIYKSLFMHHVRNENGTHCESLYMRHASVEQIKMNVEIAFFLI